MRKRWRSSVAMQQRARELRNNMTPEECVLWQHLAKDQMNGRCFRRQYPVGQYILDFYCPSIRLAIEVDGSIHDTQIVLDTIRTAWLQERRIHVLRFTNSAIRTTLPEVLLTIAETIEKLEDK